MKALTVSVLALIATGLIAASALSNAKPVVHKASTTRAAQIELALDAAK